MELSEAAQELRTHAEMSQRAFAAELRVHYRCVQNYETRCPQMRDPKVLLAFLGCALNRRRPDLATVFEHELIATLDPPEGLSIRISRTRGKRA
jgi:hypothetical protein